MGEVYRARDTRLGRDVAIKDPDERWQTTANIERQLKWIVESRSLVGVPVPAVVATPTRPFHRLSVAWAVVAGSLAAAFTLGVMTFSGPAAIIVLGLAPRIPGHSAD